VCGRVRGLCVLLLSTAAPSAEGVMGPAPKADN